MEYLFFVISWLVPIVKIVHIDGAITAENWVPFKKITLFND